jgi:hypothetical protein
LQKNSDFDLVLKGRGFSRVVSAAKSIAALAAAGLHKRAIRLFPQVVQRLEKWKKLIKSRKDDRDAHTSTLRQLSCLQHRLPSRCGHTFCLVLTAKNLSESTE